MFTNFNLPKNLRTEADAFLLYGIVLSQLDRQGHGGVAPDLTAYQQHMINELIQLCSVEIYSEYSQAPVTVEVKLQRYMMDFQGYTKYFKMSGATAYKALSVFNMQE